MLTLHQLRCFLATLEHGSFTAAAGALGYAQPSISEQVRLLEQQLDTTLFRRVGRGLVPTEAARALQPHAAAALAAVDEAERAVASVRELLTGTVRFGVFRTARFYLGADLVADVLHGIPACGVELVGQNSAEIAGADPQGPAGGGADRAAGGGRDMTSPRCCATSWCTSAPIRTGVHARITAADLAGRPAGAARRRAGARRTPPAASSRTAVQRTGHPLRPRVEVEDTETALEIAARGLADTVTWRGVLHRLGDRLPAGLGWAPLRPAMYETFAWSIVEGELSPASRVGGRPGHRPDARPGPGDAGTHRLIRVVRFRPAGRRRRRGAGTTAIFLGC